MIAPLLPDVLRPGLALVFCGTAPSPASFRAQAYYANPGNAFWPTLHSIGLTPERYAPQRYRELPALGLGLTDLCKTEYGSDHELSAGAFDVGALAAKLARARPAGVAFTSKIAGATFLGSDARGYGLQPAEIAAAAAVRHRRRALADIAYFVLPSPSGRARSWWKEEPWREVAAFVRERRG